ncbi:MAG: HesB/IscA family protein [Opitutaceae bacterium]
MITLTERAARKVREMREDQAPDKMLRVFVESGGCSGMQYGMSFDEPKPGDERCESEGESILIDPSSLGHLRGCAVDFDDGLHGRGFEIRNPNAKSTCGCGKSFG